MSNGPEQRPLTSWKEIANYLGKGVRTVQRWERELGLPVRRPSHNEKHVVIAFAAELDEWILTTMRQRDEKPGKEPQPKRNAAQPPTPTIIQRVRDTSSVLRRRSENLYRQSAEIESLSEKLLRMRRAS
jgi:hypothetical protein